MIISFFCWKAPLQNFHHSLPVQKCLSSAREATACLIWVSCERRKSLRSISILKTIPSCSFMSSIERAFNCFTDEVCERLKLIFGLNIARTASTARIDSWLRINLDPIESDQNLIGFISSSLDLDSAC
jgi:hypothetical protein